MSREFSLDRYREILLLAREHGYWLPRVREVGRPPLPDRRFLLLRHDIDMSVPAALQMARLESELGVTTSYYVRVHAPYYNVLEREAFRGLVAIRDLGHEIGLHYEADFYEQAGMDPLTGVRNDIRTLEALLDIRIESVSQHNPSLSRVFPELWEAYIDTYQPMLVRDIPYFGDSGRRWREGCVSEKIGKIPRMHVLVHPYAWTKWHPSWEDNYRAHGKAIKAKLDRDLELRIARLRDYLEDRERLDRERAEQYAKL